MKVLVVEPGKPAEEREIEDGLKSMQEIVGGYIEAYYPFRDPVVLICNEEGKLNGLPYNRTVGGDQIMGTFFLCGIGREDLTSIPDEYIQKYKDMFPPWI